MIILKYKLIDKAEFDRIDSRVAIFVMNNMKISARLLILKKYGFYDTVTFGVYRNWLSKQSNNTLREVLKEYYMIPCLPDAIKEDIKSLIGF